MAALVVLILWLGVNWIYQVVRKPSELFLSRERDPVQVACRNLG